MKAITLTQPWATLVALGHKQRETRSWSTNFRGEIAIHAAKGYPAEAKDFTRYQVSVGLLNGDGLPLGAFVAVADLVDCRRTGCLADLDLTATERSLGDYSHGRFSFGLANIRPIRPIGARGALSIWDVDPDDEAAIREALAAPCGRD